MYTMRRYSFSIANGAVILVTLFIYGFQHIFASFCGESAIPFSFEALPNGQPVLGCARPACFGWTADGKPATAPATFYRVSKKADGYFRKANFQPAVLGPDQSYYFKPQTAQCTSTFGGDKCSSDSSPESYWIGGIAPITNVSDQSLSLQCCKYEPLKLSADRGVAVVNPGQIVFGGEVLNSKRQYAFDYISDIVKQRRSDGTVYYEVSVRRLTCLPTPKEMLITVEPAVGEEIIRRFGNSKKSERGKAFQAPIQTAIGNGIIDANVASASSTGGGQVIGTAERTILQPVAEEQVDVIEGPFVAENDAIISEVQAEQGFELPPGQVPEGLIEEAPVQQAPSYGYPSYGYANGGGGGGGGGGGFFCFSADTLVRMASGDVKRMDELELDDWVASESDNGKLEYSIVQSWIHRNPQKLADFHRLELSDGNVLKLTGKHFIYRSRQCSDIDNEIVSRVEAKPVYAEEILIGDCLYVMDEKQNGFIKRRVVDVRMVAERGIFSPMTANGRIVVNDVLASCYNVVHSKTMQETFFSYVKEFQSVPLLKRLFGVGADSNTMELPVGIALLVDLVHYVLPTGTINSLTM